VRLVVGTNVLIGALLVGTSLPGHLVALWREGRCACLELADWGGVTTWSSSIILPRIRFL
ncbi:MAG: hypothetical protein LAO18_24285, partial [Acidobacteriia bacterium]|nr:hypothetical protein [Terriglobia bacterium]